VAHRPVAIDGVHLAALVAGDDARGQAHGAQQHHEGRGDVFAKTLLAVEPELVGAVRAKHARLQRVAVAARAQARERRLHQRRGRVGAGRHRRLRAQLRRERERARVEARRQLGIGVERGVALQRAVAKLRIALGAIAQHAHHGPVRAPQQLG
jgi:hypothetical protein